MFYLVSIHDSESNVITLVTSHHISSLRASSPGCSGSRAGKGRRACNYISSPVAAHWLSCQISTNQCKAEMSTNVKKHWKTLAKGNDIITKVVSANQHFALTFSMQIFKFQRSSCKPSFLFLSHRQRTPESLLTGYIYQPVGESTVSVGHTPLLCCLT